MASFSLARALFSRVREILQQSMKCYKRALEIEPELYEAYYFCGTVYEGHGSNVEAKAEYQQYLARAAAQGQYASECRERLRILESCKTKESSK